MFLEQRLSEPLLKKEQERLKALYDYEIDFSSPDNELNSITRLLSIICKTPLALINILDTQRVFTKSKNQSTYDNSFDRNISFCNWVIEQDDIFEICNTLKDERFMSNPFSLSTPPVIYYAGIPLKTPTGFNIGVLCVIDHIEQKMNEEQRIAMKTLAKFVIMQFELKKYNKQLKIANEKANKLAKAKDEFLSNMSHEIRTPLNAIYGFTELLNKTNLDKNQQEMLNIVKSSVEILMAIINDILDFSKIESGKLKIENHPFNLEETITFVRELFYHKANDKKLKLIFNFDKKLPIIINGDKIRISQILINLIGNAIKFTEKGFIEANIDFQEETENSIAVNFSIKDSGIGIPNDKLESIFERFEQASNDTTRKYGGTGLGLSISKSLIEMQGGKLSIESAEGTGSRFYFTLYFEKLSAEEIQKALKDSKSLRCNKKQKNKNEKNEFNEKLQNISSNSKIEILVCEDTYFNYKLIEKIFEDTVVNLSYAENGKIGFEKMQSKEFDMVLLDLQMPVIDGFEFTRVTRNELKSHVLILAMTANNSEIEKIKCLELGMNNYFTKPFKQKGLFDMIISVFNRKLKQEASVNIIENFQDDNPSQSAFQDLSWNNSISSFNFNKSNKSDVLKMSYNLQNNKEINKNENNKRFNHISNNNINFGMNNVCSKENINSMNFDIENFCFSLGQIKNHRFTLNKFNSLNTLNDECPVYINQARTADEKNEYNEIKNLHNNNTLHNNTNKNKSNNSFYNIQSSRSKINIYNEIGPMKNFCGEQKVLSYHINDKLTSSYLKNQEVKNFEGLKGDKIQIVDKKISMLNQAIFIESEANKKKLNSINKLNYSFDSPMSCYSFNKSENNSEKIRNLNSGNCLDNDSNFLECLDINDSYFSENNLNRKKPMSSFLNRKNDKKSAFHSMRLCQKHKGDISFNDQNEICNDDNNNNNYKIYENKSGIEEINKSENYLKFSIGNENFKNEIKIDKNKDLIFADSENISQIEALNIDSSKSGFFPISLNYDISFSSNNFANKNKDINNDNNHNNNYKKSENKNDLKESEQHIQNKSIQLKPIFSTDKKKQNSFKHRYYNKNLKYMSKNKLNNLLSNRISSCENISCQKNMINKRKLLKLKNSSSFRNKKNYANKSKFKRKDSNLSLNVHKINLSSDKNTNFVLMDFEKDEFNKGNISDEMQSIYNISINYECLNEISGGDYSIEKELITIFLNEFPEKVSLLKKALEDANYSDILVLSHSMKSTFAMFGIEILRKKFLEMENTVKNNTIDAKKIKKYKEFVSLLQKNYKHIKKSFVQKYQDIKLNSNDSLTND